MIELENVTKYYAGGFFRKQKSIAVNNVSLSIRKGETLGLVGESGSGKTTLGRIALRLVDPTSGTVRFDGVDLTKLSQSALRGVRQRMQILFQDPDTSLDPRMTVYECIAEPLLVWHLAEPKQIKDRVPELLGLVGLQPELAERFSFEISGGQKQRVALARVLTLDPEFLVADEPTSALDLSVQAQVLSLLKEVQKSRNMTLLFISHDLEVVRCMTDRVAVMRNGEIIEIRDTAALFSSPEHPYTRQLIRAVHDADMWFGKKR